MLSSSFVCFLMGHRLRNAAFVGVLVGVVALTTSVPDLFRERAVHDAIARREHVDESTKAKFKKVAGD